MSSCTSSVCRVLKLKQKKADAEAKKILDAKNKEEYLVCAKANEGNTTRLIVCPCNAAAMEDIELEPVLECKFQGWGICANPPCQILLPPLTFCKRRQCQIFRKANGIAPRKSPRKKPTKKRPKRQTSAKSDSSTDENASDSSAEITPRKRIPRKSSERKRPVAAALLDGSGTSASESDAERESPSPATPKNILQREPTVTLDDEFEVEKNTRGPPKKGRQIPGKLGRVPAIPMHMGAKKEPTRRLLPHHW
jgi:hypothetical protein